MLGRGHSTTSSYFGLLAAGSKRSRSRGRPQVIFDAPVPPLHRAPVRIRARMAVAGKTGAILDNVVYQSGELRVDPANRRLTRGDTEIALEPKAFAVLLVLLARAGELVTRDELLDAVWGHHYVTPATLNR